MRRAWILGVAALIAGLLGVPTLAQAAPPAQAVAAKQAGKTLRVIVKGLPSGQKARVRIKGPKGFSKSVRVRSQRVFKGLRPGRYRLTASPTATAEPVTVRKTVRVNAHRAARWPGSATSRSSSSNKSSHRQSQALLD